MPRVLIKGAELISPVEERPSDIWSEGARIKGIGRLEDPTGYQILDGRGCYVTPGLVDLQVNGIPECDFWGQVDQANLDSLSRKLTAAGVTTILPTLITDSMENLCRSRDRLKALGAVALDRGAALRMPGLHLEGPCLSPKRPGVHPPEHVIPLTPFALETLVDSSVKLVTLAPEQDPSGRCVEFLRRNSVLASLGHSDAGYDEAGLAFDQGVNMVTHIWNAMAPMHHRAGGAVTAALLDNRVTCCLICDGQHVSAPVCELVVRMKGPEKVILVTDVAAIGTSGGSLVGSSIMLSEAVRNVVAWGIADFREAILMAAYNPAKALGLEGEIGHLHVGALADMVLWDRETLGVKAVILNGEIVFSS